MVDPWTGAGTSRSSSRFAPKPCSAWRYDTRRCSLAPVSSSVSYEHCSQLRVDASELECGPHLTDPGQARVAAMNRRWLALGIGIIVAGCGSTACTGGSKHAASISRCPVELMGMARNWCAPVPASLSRQATIVEDAPIGSESNVSMRGEMAAQDTYLYLSANSDAPAFDDNSLPCGGYGTFSDPNVRAAEVDLPLQDATTPKGTKYRFCRISELDGFSLRGQTDRGGQILTFSVSSQLRSSNAQSPVRPDQAILAEMVDTWFPMPSGGDPSSSGAACTLNTAVGGTITVLTDVGAFCDYALSVAQGWWSYEEGKYPDEFDVGGDTWQCTPTPSKETLDATCKFIAGASEAAHELGVVKVRLENMYG